MHFLVVRIIQNYQKKIHKILSFAVEVTGMDSQDVSSSKVRVSFLNQGVEVWARYFTAGMGTGGSAAAAGGGRGGAQGWSRGSCHLRAGGSWLGTASSIVASPTQGGSFITWGNSCPWPPPHSPPPTAAWTTGQINNFACIFHHFF